MLIIHSKSFIIIFVVLNFVNTFVKMCFFMYSIGLMSLKLKKYKIFIELENNGYNFVVVKIKPKF